jgi:sporulation protein YlmC with PRC-barrel domain
MTFNASQRFSNMCGKFVIGAGSRELGTLADLELDLATWTTVALVVRVESNAIVTLGLKKPFWSDARVRIPMMHIEELSDIVVLRITLDDFAELLSEAR